MLFAVIKESNTDLVGPTEKRCLVQYKDGDKVTPKHYLPPLTGGVLQYTTDSAKYPQTLCYRLNVSAGGRDQWVTMYMEDLAQLQVEQLEQTELTGGALTFDGPSFLAEKEYKRRTLSDIRNCVEAMRKAFESKSQSKSNECATPEKTAPVPQAHTDTDDYTESVPKKLRYESGSDDDTPTLAELKKKAAEVHTKAKRGTEVNTQSAPVKRKTAKATRDQTKGALAGRKRRRSESEEE